MLQDRYGLPVSTSSASALGAYVEGVDRLLSANAGAEESFDAAFWRSGRAAAAALLERRLDRQPTVPGPRSTPS